MELTKQPPVNENDITLKQLIIQSWDWINFYLRKWKIIVLFGVIGAALGIAYAYSKKPKYVAELTFVLEDSKGSGLNAYAGIASQFGIDLGGSSASGLFSGDNMLTFLKSRLMIEKTLLSPIVIDNKEISLAEHYVNFQEIREGWKGKPKLENLHFPVNPDRRKFRLEQDSILNIIYKAMINDHISVIKPDKKLSFIAVSCATEDQAFSKLFTERLVDEASNFYVATRTKRSKANVDLLQQKADSIIRLLNRKTFAVAASQDLNVNPVRKVASVATELQAVDKTILQTMYGEVTKNLELSKISMAQETPLIQIVDSPILPLKKEKFGRLKGIIIGGFLGGFLTMLILGTRRLYKQIMQ